MLVINRANQSETDKADASSTFSHFSERLDGAQ